MKEFNERFIDSQPILQMLKLLTQAGRTNFHENGVWEICLCALILAIEPKCSLQRILQALPYHDNPLDAADMLNTMAHLGYSCCKADTELDIIDERLLPAVFIPKGGLPSIVMGRNVQGELRFYDPMSKLISYVPPSFDSGGNIWFFQPYDAHRQPTSKFMRQGSGYSWFRALLGRFKGTFVQILTAGLILNLITLITPLFIMLVYDKVIAAGSIGTLPMLAVGALIAIGFEWKMRQVRSTGLSWLAGRLDNIVGNKIFAHLIGLSPSLIEQASISAQIARIKTFESVRDFFSGSVFLSLLEAPFVILAIAAVAFIAGGLVWVPLMMTFGYLALFLFIRTQVKMAIRLAAKTSSMRQQFTIETFEKLEGIKTNGMAEKWQDKFRHLSGREMMAHFHLNWLGQVAENVGHTLTIIAAVATVGFGVQRIWDGEMTTGALVATMILVWRILTPFYSLCTMIPRLEQLRKSIEQVNILMDIDTEAEEARAFSRLPQIKGMIAFNNVSFRYNPDSDDIFTDLSFELKAGEVLMITGGNGTGKASILKLIQSLYIPSHGAVRIDGFDIRQLDSPDIRRQIAYVPKVAHLFTGTIIENMRFTNPLASMEDIRQALELADAYADISKLSDGLNTRIGNGGMTLPSSLATRLSLARAYLHNGNILLIDELPNSLLSGKMGNKLREYIIRNKGKKTIIFCTYRADFMQLADHIIWLRAGEQPVVGERQIMLPKLAKSSQSILSLGVSA
jgi:ABC-type bacteriocin/lantibiotic exporter with double-glycine peptidase domain